MPTRLTPLILALFFVGACTPPPTAATPAGSVRLFIRTMGQAQNNDEALRTAFALLSRDDQRALLQRAREASSGGQQFEPWQMLVPGSFRLNFAPGEGEGAMREAIDGERAVVTVRDRTRQRSAQVHLLFEEGSWRIQLLNPG